MEAVVSDILNSRKQEPAGLARTSVISLAVHAGAAVALLALPSLLPAAAQRPRIVMSISLGGAPGPVTGGTQMIGGKSIQAAQPSAAPTVTPSTFPTPPTPPKMVLPDPKQKPRAPARSNATSKDPLGTARGRGFETQVGTARVDTGAKGQGFGLSSSGGGGGGSRLDTKDFCCPEYVVDMLKRIRGNWVQQQQATGVVMTQFTIARDGQLTNIQVEMSSGNPLLDIASQRALMTTKSIAPLPTAFPDSQLTVHLEFRYER